MLFFETSAKTSEQVENSFYKLILELIKQEYYFNILEILLIRMMINSNLIKNKIEKVLVVEIYNIFSLNKL
jgi:hypothetical protein